MQMRPSASHPVIEVRVDAVVGHIARRIVNQPRAAIHAGDLIAAGSITHRGGGGHENRGKPVEVRGLPLNHDKTVVEWGTAVLGYLMTGPPALRSL